MEQEFVSDRAYVAVLRDGCVLQEHSVYAATPRGPGFGRWALPGGGLLPGESFADAATREAREELGCGVILGPVGAITEFLQQRTGERSVHLVFGARIEPGDEPRVPEDQPDDPDSGRVTELRWLAAADLPDHLAWLRDIIEGRIACHYELHRH